MNVYTNAPTTATIYTNASNNTAVWIQWIQTASTTATTTLSTIDTWINWNTSCTNCTTTITDPWPQWNRPAQHINRAINVGSRIRAQQAAPYVPRKKTDAEVQADLLHQQKWEKEKLEREAKEFAAKQKAEKLLLGVLSPEQRDDLAQKACFYLHTQSGRKYRIERRTHGNIFLLDERGREVRRFCAQPNGVPTDDAILAQKLALETDEEAFLLVANATNLG